VWGGVGADEQGEFERDQKWRRLTLAERDLGLLGVNGVEKSLIPDIRLGNQVDLGANVRHGSR